MSNNLPFIQLPLNPLHFKPLPIISDNVIRLPLIREPSSSVETKEKQHENQPLCKSIFTKRSEKMRNSSLR